MQRGKFLVNGGVSISYVTVLAVSELDAIGELAGGAVRAAHAADVAARCCWGGRGRSGRRVVMMWEAGDRAITLERLESQCICYTCVRNCRQACLIHKRHHPPTYQ